MVDSNNDKTEATKENLTEASSQTQSAQAGYRLSAEEQKQRKRRNLAIGLSIVGFVILVYLVTIIRLGASVTERSF